MDKHQPFESVSNMHNADQQKIRQFKRSCVRDDVQQAQVMLDNFTIIITAKKKEPTF